MGIVYLAHDIDLAREVALKIVLQTQPNEGDVSDALRREAAALASIRHENVVQVYGFGPHQSGYFIAMEHVRGRSLDHLIASFAAHGGFLPLHRALTILVQIAGGLDAAHAKGLIHRDVKPGNIVIETQTGRPVLIDFGLALRLAQDDPGDGSGTPLYRAPEQAIHRKERLGPGADVYALACTAFELLVNRPPFMADTVEELTRLHVLAPPPRLSSLRPELAALDDVMARALAKRPDWRFGTVLELRDAFAIAGSDWIAPSTQLPTTTPPPASTVTVFDRPDTVLERPALRVLVVDDDDDFRKLSGRAVQLALFDLPLRLAAVASGADALASARRRPPQLVVLDYDMPGLDGLETLSRLRAQPHGTDARVVVVSGRVGDGERYQFELLGVEDFVRKPVQLPELVHALDAIARRNGWISAGAARSP
jgi:serine/threonine-protein kinase